jgi:hypothetical protein
MQLPTTEIPGVIKDSTSTHLKGGFVAYQGKLSLSSTGLKNNQHGVNAAIHSMKIVVSGK